MPGRRYDAAHRRRGKRTSRERGCWLYVPQEVLQAAHRDLESGPPWYRVWPSGRGTVIVRFYKEA